MDLTILKLGGSIITHKYEGGEFDQATTERLIREIRHALDRSPQRLIIIHGAGGKVHRLAHEFNLENGAYTPDQITGALKTHLAIRELTQQILPILSSHDLPIAPLPTNSMFINKSSRLEVVGIELIQRALDLGLIPLLSGDMIFDDQTNFSILSGDQIAAILARQLNAQRIIFASNVDGLYSSDPKINPTAKLIEHAQLNNINTAQTAIPSIDTTNQMLGKITALVKESGTVPVQIINGLVADRLTHALIGQPVTGTILE